VMEEAEQMVTAVLIRNMKGQGWTSLATIGGWFNSPPETQEVKEALQIVKTKHKQLKNFVAASRDVAVREMEGKKGTFEILLAEDYEKQIASLSKQQQKQQEEASINARTSVVSTDIATSDETQEERDGRARSYRVQRALLELVPQVLVHVFSAAWEKHTGKEWSPASGKELKSMIPDKTQEELKKRIGAHGLQKIEQGNTAKWDITLFALLLLDNPGIIKKDKDASKALRDLRTERNGFVHELHTQNQLAVKEFDDLWSKVTGLLSKLCAFTGKGAAKQLLESEMAKILKEAVDAGKERKYAAEMRKLEQFKDALEGLEEQMGGMTVDVQMLKKKQENVMTQSMFGRKAAEMQKEMQAEMKAELEKLKAAIPKGAESLEAQAIREGKQVVDISNGKKYAFSRENDQLGSGAQGMVFKATCLSDGSLIALKLVPLKKGTQIQDREHTNLEKLNHPNVVNLFGHCKTDAHLVLAMELVVGTAYDDYLKEKGGKVPWQEAKSDFLHIIKGMQKVHDESIVHRDLKPANIMRRRNGWCVIVDFGLSKDSKVVLGTQSTAGGFKGTKAYSAPELLKNNEATPAIDVFSIGVMLYESMSGYLPWPFEDTSTKSTERASCSVLGEGSSEFDNMQYSMNTAKVPPTALRPDEAPASINDFVLRCLAPVEKRFKSAGEMLKPWEDAIEAASEELAFWSMSFGNTEKSVPRDDLAKKFADKFSLTQQQADKLVGDMDADSSGGISPEEMINFFSGRNMAEKVAEYKLAAVVVDCLKNALEIEGVKFQSKGTMLGGKKDRVGMLRLHKDEVIAFRIDGRDKISVYSFRVTVSKMERIAGKPEVFVGPDAGGKSRSFTFASEKDTDRFVNAFRSTKAALLEEF